MEELKVKKRARDDSEESELELDSPEVKRLRENLLESLDDDDDAAEISTTSQDLDSFMKSFEEEITASPAGEAVKAADLTDSGESRLDLGYLLGASDDELGLPPTAASPSPGGVESDVVAELVRAESDSSELGNEFWEMTGYDSFGFGFGGSEANFNNGEFVALDGLFDYSDMGFGSGDFTWRPETLPAQ